MKIQKFYSNSKLALKSLPESLLSNKVHFSDKEEVFDLNKVLGMVWDANTDLITYNAKYKNADQTNLSQIMLNLISVAEL